MSAKPYFNNAVCAGVVFAAAFFVIGPFTAPSAALAAGHTNLLDGDLVKRADHPDVFIVKIKNGKYFKRLILNPDIFNSYGHLSWDNIKIVSEAVLDEMKDIQLVIEVNPDGTSVTGRVFVLTSEADADSGIKHHMQMSAQDFELAGHDWDGIYFINYTEAADAFYPEGVVRIAAALNTQSALANLSVGAQQTTIVRDGGTLMIIGDLSVARDGRLSFGDNSRLSVSGNLTIEDGGVLSCGHGELRVDVGGNLRVDGDIECRREERDLPEGDLGLGIVMVTSGSASLSRDSELVSNGHIVVVDDPSLIPTTREAIDDLYSDAAADTGTDPRIGPIFPESEDASGRTLGVGGLEELALSGVEGLYDAAKSVFGGLFAGVFPQVIQDPAPAGPCFDPATGAWIPDCTEVSGEQWVWPYPPGTKRIVLLRRNTGELRLTDYALHGPPTPKGADGPFECTSVGEPGPDALRLNGRAPVIRINNFIVHLPHGGDGGNGETPECDDAYAEGGAGGQAGNFKLEASRTLSIEGDFIIHPGWGGNGGYAIASGKNQTQCGATGGKAEALGGAGADNIKELRIQGAVSGTSNIQIGSMYGGYGGNALAIGGKGGNFCSCTQKGGDGGDATATGGKGGDAKVTLAGDVGSTVDAEDVAGNGGDAQAYGGHGGDGGDCPTCTNAGPGGPGGAGGDAEATEGKAGMLTTPGTDGMKTNPGGNGGNGGDGCPPGPGGPGGSGDPSGNPGSPGVNTCHDLTGVIDVSIFTDVTVFYLDETATFTAIIDHAVGIASFKWYVGDVLVGNELTFAYLFSGPGTYTLRLEVIDINGNTGSATRQVTVQQRSQAETPLGFFELLRLPAYTPVTTLPVPGQTHIIVASDGTPDMRTFLPMTLTLTANGEPYWNTTIANNPVANCRDATGCSIDGPNLPSSLQGAALRLEARGKNNELLAGHTQ